MDYAKILEKIDVTTLRAFIGAALRVVDALLIEAERAGPLGTPAPRDYRHADMPRTAPPGGWLSAGELRSTAQRMSEAVAAERWVEGFTTAVKLLAVVGGGL